jgi:tRNA (cmo5U34)-methyltransferase
VSAFAQNFADPEKVARYTTLGPPAFMPGHGGVLQMAGVLLAETVPGDGQVLVVGAGGGLDTQALAKAGPTWRFVGVDPAPAMLDLARAVVGPEVNERLELIEGVAADAPAGPFDAATLILVLGMIPDDGSKLSILEEIHRRLKPGAPFILVDRCGERTGPAFERDVDRYIAYAVASGVDEATLASARDSQRANAGLVPPARNEALLTEAGFTRNEVFYVGMAWRGWIGYA